MRKLIPVLMLGLLAGCGGTSSPTTADAPAPAATTTAAAAEPDNACAQAQLEIQAGLQVDQSVTAVEVPSCDQAIVKTSLTADQSDLAWNVCQIAANEASAKGVKSVSVQSADGKELSTGTTPENCTGLK